MSFPAALSTLGLAQQGIQRFSPPFGAGRMCAHRTAGLDFCFFACFYFAVETVMTAYCYSFLFHKGTKLWWSSQAVLVI